MDLLFYSFFTILLLITYLLQMFDYYLINKRVMIKSINLCFEEAEKQLVSCSKCNQPLFSLHQATCFIKADKQCYFFFKTDPEQNDIQTPFWVVSQSSVYTQIRECFFLMQAMSIECAKCTLSIGLTFTHASSREQEWLVGGILFDPTFLEFTPRQVKSQLIDQLIEELQLDESGSQQKDRREGRGGMGWADLVNESLSNIAFYSQMMDQLKQRFNNYHTIQMYNRVRKSKKKERLTED